MLLTYWKISNRGHQLVDKLPLRITLDPIAFSKPLLWLPNYTITQFHKPPLLSCALTKKLNEKESPKPQLMHFTLLYFQRQLHEFSVPLKRKFTLVIIWEPCLWHIKPLGTTSSYASEPPHHLFYSVKIDLWFVVWNLLIICCFMET